jgi:hypothetical protein
MAARNIGGYPMVKPLLHRADKPGVIDVAGQRWNNQDIAATLQESWDKGFDAVMIKNYTSPAGKSGDILVVQDPVQLRSPYAQFDPAKRQSRDLLAGIAGAAALGAAGSLPIPPQQAPIFQQ